MNPGRELDALIAEKVFGKSEPDRGCMCSLRESCYVCNPFLKGIKPYSTDIAAAWEVVEKIKLNKSLHDGFTLTFDLEEKRWRAGSLWWRGYEQAEWLEPNSAMAETAPHAICLAALKALE